MEIIKKLKKPNPSKAYETFWRFAAERQEIFFRRFNNNAQPWTDDQVLLKHKFTNAYRASDRVSQYLIKKVIYNGDKSPEEVFFRVILFKLFNKIDTWELLKYNLDDIKYSTYSFSTYNDILSNAINSGERIYSGAYIMASGKSFFGFSRKYQNHLKLIESMMSDNLPLKINKSNSLEEVFYLLKSYPMLGDFLAYQYTIDLNYSELIEFSEMEFVVPGPGAKNGIKKCFTDLGDYTEIDIIKYMTEIQNSEFDKYGIVFKDLWGRPLQLIDVQNLFCEVDKYARVAHPEINGISNRKRIKQIFNPNEEKITYRYPPKWEINKKINNYEQSEECIHQSL